MHIFSRFLQLPDLTKQNVFLWGPRKVGKSSWIRHNLPHAVYIDLLKSDIYSEYASNPALLRERYAVLSTAQASQPIVIDEIQRCPPLLDEVHFWRTSNKQEVDFILNDKEVALEIKSSSKTALVDCKNLSLVREDGAIKRRILVSFDQQPKILSDRFGAIEILPWREFLQQLWQGLIVA